MLADGGPITALPWMSIGVMTVEVQGITRLKTGDVSSILTRSISALTGDGRDGCLLSPAAWPWETVGIRYHQAPRWEP